MHSPRIVAQYVPPPPARNSSARRVPKHRSRGQGFFLAPWADNFLATLKQEIIEHEETPSAGMSSRLTITILHWRVRCKYRSTEHGREGEALLGGVVTENSPIEAGQQGTPTIAEMVEGIPGANQLMSRVGRFFRRVARTEVLQVPATHVTPPRRTTRSTGSPDGAPQNLSMEDTLNT